MGQLRRWLFIILALAVLPSQLIHSSAQTIPTPTFSNGGFEVDTNSDGKPDQWSWPGSDWVWDESIAHSGSRSARILRSGGSSTAYLVSASVSVMASTTYTLTYWLRTQNASRYPNSLVYQYNSRDQQIGPYTHIRVDVEDGTSRWQRIVYRFQTAPDASYVRLLVYLNTSTTGTFWFDDFVLEAGPAALYPFQSGFPVQTQGWNRSSPVVADIDDDGDNELLVGNYSGMVYALDATGSLLPGFPLETGGAINGHLALGDLNQDGDLEIAAGVGAEVLGTRGHVFVWQPNGTLLPGWPQSVARLGSTSLSRVNTVALADIDGDSDLEVLAGTNNNALGVPNPPDTVSNLYAWHHTGQPVAGSWPAEDGPSLLGTLAVGDLDSDSQVDIITGRDYNRLFAYDGRGNHLSGWPIRVFWPEQWTWEDDQIEYASAGPALADLDGDGEIEYVVAGLVRHATDATYFSTALLVYQPDGSRRPGWEKPAGGTGVLAQLRMWHAASIADLDGDYRLDIVLPTQDGWIRAYAADKTLLWQFEYAQGNYIYASEPVIGDVDDDGLYEIVFGTYDPLNGSTGPVGLWILEHNGAVKAGMPLPVEAPGIIAGPALADLDRDHDLEIVAVTRLGLLYVWDTPASFDPTRLPWPVVRHDMQRTAFFVDATPDLSSSIKTASVSTADLGEAITYTLHLIRTGRPLTQVLQVADTVPTGLSYIPGTLAATYGTPDDSLAPTLRWTGRLSDVTSTEITYAVYVTEPSAAAIVNTAAIGDGSVALLTSSALVIVNGEKVYLPVVSRGFDAGR
jgi:uncharacterized repeat protein (TIGR01451 family)